MKKIKPVFKTLSVMRLNAPNLDLAQLEEKAQQAAFVPCGALDEFRIGFIPVLPEEAYTGISIDGLVLMKIKVQTKRVGKADIDELVDARVSEWIAKGADKPNREELKALREEARQTLLARVLPKSRVHAVVFDTRHNWVWFDTAARVRDDLIGLLCQCWPTTWEGRWVEPVNAPASVMAGWLGSMEGPAGFTLDEDLQLKDPEDSTVTFARLALEGQTEEIHTHLGQGFRPALLGMTLVDNVSFQFTEEFGFKKLALADAIDTDAVDGAEGQREVIRATLLLEGEVIRKLLREMLDALGGEVKAEAEMV